MTLRKRLKNKALGLQLSEPGGPMISETTGLWMESQNWPVKMDLLLSNMEYQRRKIFLELKKRGTFFLAEAVKVVKKDSETHYLPPQCGVEMCLNDLSIR